ncbi:MAG: glutathione S-transferase family protein [Rhodobacteraceae bacterium]|nr:MAG: glutathione S-transferase family protein [Paracoccaceae bacterium]
MTKSYVLHYAPDNASLIVRLVLDELGQPYRTRLVDRRRGAQRDEAYLQLNPNGLIPTLETPHGAIFETGAILLWLADRHKAMAPGPKDPERGEFLKWLFFISNTLHADLRISFYPAQYAGSGPATLAALRKKVQERIARHLGLLDDVAASGVGWFGGEAPSVLDYYVMCCARWTALYPIEGPHAEARLEDFPSLLSMAQRLEARPATARAIEAEGLGPRPFTRPKLPNPPEGSPM